MKSRSQMIMILSAARLAMVLVGLAALHSTAYSQETRSFDVWLAALRQEAVSKGYSEEAIELAFSEVAEPVQRILTNDRNQAEVVQTYAGYLNARVSEWKETHGRLRMQEHQALLKDVESEYGVQARFIVSIWGMETNFGTYPITEPLFSVLATLAFDERRADFYRAQFFDALTMLDSGFPSYDKLKSSWAGALGQSQFIPENYLRYAVDFDGDGKRDIWDTTADVFASIANYISKYGWSYDETWGQRVTLPGEEGSLVAAQADGIAPDGRCERYRTLGAWRDLQDWRRLGVRNADGSDLPAGSMPAALVTADPNDGEGFIVYRNFCTIMRFNPAFKYALSIGLLSDLVNRDGSLP